MSLEVGPNPIYLRLLMILKLWVPESLRQPPPGSGATANPHPRITVRCTLGARRAIRTLVPWLDLSTPE